MVYFRNGNPLLFEGKNKWWVTNEYAIQSSRFSGDLQNEESVLEWLIDDENRELADEIEEVNARMLDRLMEESLYLAVLFCKLA